MYSATGADKRRSGNDDPQSVILIDDGSGEQTGIGRVRKVSSPAGRTLNTLILRGGKRPRREVEAFGKVGSDWWRSGNGLEALKQSRLGRTGRGCGAEGPNGLERSQSGFEGVGREL
jgi:hypothetical protein